MALQARLARLVLMLGGFLTLSCGGGELIAPAHFEADSVGASMDTVPTADSGSGHRSTAQLIGCRNEPKGFTEVSNQPFDAVPPMHPSTDIHGWRNETRIATRMQVVSDPTAPVSRPSVIQGTFSKGAPGGSGPFKLELRLPATVTRIYSCLWTKLSGNFTNNGNAGTKFGFLETNRTVGDSSRLNHYFNLTDEMGIHLQSTPSSLNRTMHSSWRTRDHLGEWHQLEFLIIANSKGNRDGAARMWVDGTPVLDQEDVRYFKNNQDPGFTGLTWNPTYGGGPHPVPYDMYQWIDHWYVSSR